MSNLETLQKLYAAGQLIADIDCGRMTNAIGLIQEEFDDLASDWFSRKVTLCLSDDPDFYDYFHRVALLKITDKDGKVYLAEIEMGLGGRAVVKMSDDNLAAWGIKGEIEAFLKV